MGDLINFNDSNLQFALVVVILCPLIWNSVARFLHSITAGGQKIQKQTQYILCYMMTVWIFGFSTYRDLLFHNTINTQPIWHTIQNPLIQLIGLALIISGQVFVLSSMWALGITGTFLGDYVGILMDAPVRTFPFTYLENPMYVGATMCFTGYSLWASSAAGLLIAAEVFVVYQIALMFEGPYTAMIYRNKAAREAKGTKKSK